MTPRKLVNMILLHILKGIIKGGFNPPNHRREKGVNGMKHNAKKTRHKWGEIYKCNNMYFIKEYDNLYYEWNSNMLIGKGYKCFDECIDNAIIKKGL